MPPPFRWIVDRCLAKNANERYASTTDLHRRPGNPSRSIRRGCRAASRQFRHTARKALWRRSLLGAGVAAAVLAGAIVATVNGDTRQSAGDALTFTPLTTDPGYEGMPAWSPDGQTIAYVADVDNTLQVFTRQRAASVSAQITQAPYDCRHPFWSPDGKRLYFISLARERESLWSISAAGGTPQVVIENVTRAAISPDGETIAFLRDEQPADIVGAATLWFWTASGGEQKYQGFDGRRLHRGCARIFSRRTDARVERRAEDDRCAARRARVAAVGRAVVRRSTVPSPAVDDAMSSRASRASRGCLILGMWFWV